MQPIHGRAKNCVAIVGMAALVLLSCTAKTRFKKAKELQEQYEYQSAIAAYEEVASKHPKSKWADSANVAIEECQAVLEQIDNNFEEVSRLSEAERYDEASAKLEGILSLGVNDEVTAQVKQYIEEIEKAKRSSYSYIINVVVGKMRKGTSPGTAAEEFKGVQFKWTATVGSIGYGISTSLPPVDFNKGKWIFWGFPSAGINQLEYYLFCERNRGKTVTVEGTILGGTDWPETPLAVEVTGISLGGKQQTEQTTEQ